MMDFLMISTRNTKQGIEVYPKFIIKKSQDLMIRGGDFYAIWLEDRGLWSTDEQDAIHAIDQELDNYAEANGLIGKARVLHLWDAETGMIDKWHRYCQGQMRDNYSMLDENLIFSNHETNKKDYASKRLNYPLEAGPITAYDKLISTLYSPEERAKLEWAIGAIVSGDSKLIQKFIVLYGGPGTGKSTVLNIIQKLFDGYYSIFDAKALGSNGSQFALEAFRKNPLVAIQHDGDLSRIEDNTRLNSLVSHEEMTVNEKYTKGYTNRFKAFLFMGTNKPVKITDSKSGLIRRLIDVTPTGNTVRPSEYKKLTKQVDFELGHIAKHCLDFYISNPNRYEDYTPVSMMGASNDFYNFVEDSLSVFYKDDETTSKAAWEMYKNYCEEARVPYPLTLRVFKEELKSYFWEFKDRHQLDDGTRVRNYYCKFRIDKFEPPESKPEVQEQQLIEFKCTESILDKDCADCPAQYATDDGKPIKKWDSVKTKLSEIDTSKIHYVKVPVNHIVIDFDIPDENGEKSLEKNLVEASKWPATYAELSKSGKGIHLHYIYAGDVSKLSRVYDDKIEVKIFNGKSSLRRKFTKCNGLPIASISSGLPLKGESKMISNEVIKSERGLRTLIKRNLKKEIHPGTKPSIDFIDKILNDAYDSGLKYDVTDMRNAVLGFAASSTNQAPYCLKLVSKMKFKSDDISEPVTDDDAPLVFYDVEVFPNLFLVNWKYAGEDKPVVRMINPKPSAIEDLMKFKLVGFNCRRYDNHILYARLMGYTNEQLYNLSQKIINGDGGFFGEAYNVSYTDVYDFCAKKQSLKKWEIELGIVHKELGLKWDEPVPEERWIEVAEYCDNDVIATEAVFNARKADFIARQILAKITGGSVNDTTNSLSTKLVFGNNRKPQTQFNYRDMGTVNNEDRIPEGFDDYTRFNDKNQPVFPGYEYSYGKSIYRGEEVGEGGYVYAEPGIYTEVALLDVASMHPTSIENEVLFGEEYTARFSQIKKARVLIKRKQFEEVYGMLGGALDEFIDEIISGKAWYTSDDLAFALKIVINSIYGLTAARFENPFRDPRNVDNIVAKRGALFMINLKHEVQKRGYTVAHIKTDSIKIPNADEYIIDFVMNYGKMYGYDFEHEATYDKMCLVNDAVYIAKYQDGDWTATGAQFAVPYVFKTLFSKEPIEFSDLCETKSVTGSLYLDMNEELEDIFVYEKELEDRAKGKKRLNPDLENCSVEDLEKLISNGHNYIFVGKVGRFCPIKPGCGGGVLYREKDGKYYAAGGTKGYRWLESEVVESLGKQNDIDRSYYDALVDASIESISQYGDVEWFTSDDPVGELDLIPREPNLN